MQNVTLVAELGLNHGGRLDVAKRMAKQAISCGANAIKVQYYNSARLVRYRNSVGAYKTDCDEQAEYETLSSNRLALPSIVQLRNSVWSKYRIPVFASAFDPYDVAALRGAGFRTVKLSVEQGLRTEMVEAAARWFGKPNCRIIQSIGLPQILGNVLSKTVLYGPNVTTLYCPPGYPTESAIDFDRFFHRVGGVNTIGASLHIANPERLLRVIPLLMGRGCKMFELHFRDTDDCPERQWSLNPQQFKQVSGCINAANIELGLENVDAEAHSLVV